MARWRFDNRHTHELPADPDRRNHPRQVFGACHTPVEPTPAPRPELLAFSPEMAAQLGFDPEDDFNAEFAEVFAGNRLMPGMEPHASCYGGHQFGQWAGQLGDGRAINLGEVLDWEGRHWMLQLKGAGPTPYSRTADGYAVLRSSVREFLCSEAMHHLGVPTTRALSLVTTGRSVIRDLFYDGHPRAEPGAVVCRVAPSFIRFGHFELFAARGDLDTLRKLADFTLRSEFAHLGAPGPETYAAWFDEVCQRTAELIVHWQRVGFVHGVMNTDNMSILGLTIDYGPYGWLEDYDPDWTPNTTDAHQRRYRYANQPGIAAWNLHRLANALHPLVGRSEPLEAALNGYVTRFEANWQRMMADKLGLRAYDDALVSELLELLQSVETDMTLFYRHLAQVDLSRLEEAPDGYPEPLHESLYQSDSLPSEVAGRMLCWLRRYRDRVEIEGRPHPERIAGMNAVNPLYVPRNWLLQMAIDRAEQGDPEMIRELLTLFRHPYDEQAGQSSHATKRPEWARHRAGCSMLSCSS